MEESSEGSDIGSDQTEEEEEEGMMLMPSFINRLIEPEANPVIQQIYENEIRKSMMNRTKSNPVRSKHAASQKRYNKIKARWNILDRFRKTTQTRQKRIVALHEDISFLSFVYINNEKEEYNHQSMTVYDPYNTLVIKSTKTMSKKTKINDDVLYTSKIAVMKHLGAHPKHLPAFVNMMRWFVTGEKMDYDAHNTMSELMQRDITTTCIIPSPPSSPPPPPM